MKVKKRLVVGGLFFAVLLLLGIAVSGCGGEMVQPSQEDELINELFTIKGAEFLQYREGTDDPWSRGRPSLVWYRPEESRRDIAPPHSGGTPELPGYYTYIITYFDERYAAGVYRYFTEERFLNKSFDLVMFRVEMVDGGSGVHASLEKIRRGDCSWSGSKQRSLDEIERLLSGLSVDYLWKSRASLNAFLERLKLAEISVFEGQDYRHVTKVLLREAVEILFQDAFSGSGVEAKLVGPSAYCSHGFDGKDGECWIRGHIRNSELQLQLVANAGEATAALRSLPDAVKDLIGEVEVLTLADSEFGVVWGRTSWLGFQDKFGNWFIFVS